MIFGVPIILAITAFVFVIFIHELGHYLMGRFCGIGATSFSIGFGPKLVSFTDRHDTEWMICLIPLGGYVKFQTNSESTQKDFVSKEQKQYWKGLQANKSSFEDSSILARALTVFAGPFANFLMSAFIFAFVYQVSGVMSDEPIVGDVVTLPSGQISLMSGDKILSVQGNKIDKFSQVYQTAATMEELSTINFRVLRDEKILDLDVPYLFQPVVFHVEMFSPAMTAGIEVGDVFVKANSKIISSFDELKVIINSSGAAPIFLEIWRNGAFITTTIIPELRPTETQNGNFVEEMRIGVHGGPLLSPMRVTPNIFQSGKMGMEMTFYIIKTSLIGVARMIDMTISPKHLSGPVGVARALSYTASEGYIPFLSLVAAISAGIGLVNLFPIPILDGGHLMVLLYESIFKIPPPETTTKFLMVIGFAILFALMVFTTFNDIVR